MSDWKNINSYPSIRFSVLAAQKAKAGGGVPVISNVMSLAPPGQKPGAVTSSAAQRTANVPSQAGKVSSSIESLGLI